MKTKGDRGHKVSLDVLVGQGGDGLRVITDRPFNLGLLGDFSGAVGRDHAVASAPISVDADNVQDLAGIRPELVFDFGKLRVPLCFAGLDDFHPDRLYERMPMFEALREFEARLSGPAAFATLSDEFETSEQRPAPGLLDTILVETEPEQGTTRRAQSPDVQAYVRHVLRPHLVHEGSQRQLEMREGVEREVSQMMRRILHEDRFRRLEAAWRSVFYVVVNALRIHSRIRVWLIDVPQDQLAGDLGGVGSVGDTVLGQILAGRGGTAPNGSPWSILATVTPFGLEESDSTALARLGELGSLLGAPWIAGVRDAALSPDHADGGPASSGGADSRLHTILESVRAQPAARYLGLAYPGFLLRLPFGKEGEPCDTFRFEEIVGEPSASDYLWGDSAVLCALAAAALALPDSGEPPASFLDVEGLPLHVWTQGEEPVARACTDVTLDEQAVRRLISGGLIAVQSAPGRGRVRIVRLSSVTGAALPIAAF